MAGFEPVAQAPYGAPELAPLAARQEAGRDAATEAPGLPGGVPGEALLWMRHRDQGDASAREELILLHLPYARAVAGGLFRLHVHHDAEFQEYVQWATVGLIEAVDRYDPNRGAQFRTYAHLRMQGAIRNGLEHATERQEQISLHRKLTAERLSAARQGKSLGASGTSTADLFRDVAEVSALLMLTFMLDDTGMLQDEGSSLPDHCYESLAFKDEQKRLRERISHLTPREQSVVKLHYFQGLTCEDIARTLGITKGRVSQLHEQALVRLRKLIAP